MAPWPASSRRSTSRAGSRPAAAIRRDVVNPPVGAEYITTEVETVGSGTRLPDIARLFERWNISAVPVTDLSGRPVGVVSRTDLLRVARRTGVLGREPVALQIPDLPAVAVMTR